jgi:hypothetical protein
MSGTVADNINRQSGVIAEPAGGPEVRSDDPSASAGTVWFNTTSGVLKVFRLVTGWSTVNSLLTGVYAGSGAGTESAGLSFGGKTAASAQVTETEEWDGTSWTADDGNLASAVRDQGGFGIQTAAVSFGGYNGSSRLSTSEEYNGSAWGAGGALNESVNGSAGAGTLTAGMRCGGET